ncbi:MAG: hypothetical protein J1E39_03605 [Eubacterium sp.]|nr:hypothetical protein [Eubacterium sp.]
MNISSQEESITISSVEENSNADNKSEVESETETESKEDSETESDIASETEAESKEDSETESDAVSEIEIESKVDSETEPETLVDPDRQTNVRNTCWGDSIEIVKSVETLELIEENDEGLLYETSISGAMTSIVYNFNNDKLYSVYYYMDDKDHSTGNVMLSRFSNLSDMITEKYGKPSSEDYYVLSNLANYCSDDGQALELGYAAWKNTWSTADEDILLSVLAQNYHVNVIASFTSKKIDAPVEESPF